MQASATVKPITSPKEEQNEDQCTVPTVRVCLVQDVRLKPDECVPVHAQMDGDTRTNMQPLLVKNDRVHVEERGLQMVEAILPPNKDGLVQVCLVNCLDITQRLQKGLEVGKVQPVEVISKVNMEVNDCSDTLHASKGNTASVINAIDSTTKLPTLRDTSQRKGKLTDYLSEEGVNSNLTTKEHQQMLSFLKDCHNIFSLDDGDRGETDLVEMRIKTGDTPPKKQAARRAPFAVRHKFAVQLQKMLKQNGI